MSSLGLRVTDRRLYAPRVDGWWLWRVCEWIASAAAMAALIPLLAAAGGAILLLSRRSPFVAHRRIGVNGEAFWMWKFRTMWGGPERLESRGGLLVERIETKGAPAPKQAGDPRVTSRMARLLRRYSLDELPQLAHVVTGRMSLVGPRPMVRDELHVHYGADVDEVLSVPPGLTGLWQVSGRSRLSYPQRRAMDLYLVRNRSVGLYLSILARTMPAVARGADSW